VNQELIDLIDAGDVREGSGGSSQTRYEIKSWTSGGPKVGVIGADAPPNWNERATSG
jgi:hypothetical protein